MGARESRGMVGPTFHPRRFLGAQTSASPPNPSRRRAMLGPPVPIISLHSGRFGPLHLSTCRSLGAQKSKMGKDWMQLRAPRGPSSRADRAGLKPGWAGRRGGAPAPDLGTVRGAERPPGRAGPCAMGNRSAADADGLLAGRGPGTGGGAGGPGAAAALAGGVLLIGAVLAGNSLVCVSVAAERALQTPTNYFILSLAAADLLLALLVLPLFVYSEVSPRRDRTRTLTCSLFPVPSHTEDPA